MGLKLILLSSLYAITFGEQTNSNDDVCSLLNVECGLETGFTVSINEDCREQSFPQLPANYQDQGLFLTHIDLDKNPDKTAEVLSNLNKDCEFPESGTLTFDFKTCGEMKAEVVDDTDYTIFTIYFNYRKKLGDDYIAIVDQIPIQCKLGHVVMSTDEGAKIGLGEEDVLSFELIKGTEITADFDLDLQVGSMNTGQFKEFGAGTAVDVGTLITLRMVSNTDTDYVFALMNCKAESGGRIAELYEDECPTDVVVSSIGLSWLSFISFTMPVFRIAAETEVTFSCGIGAFPSEDDLPTPCDAADIPDADDTSSGRRRRSDIKNDTAEKEQVSVTISLIPERKLLSSRASLDGYPKTVENSASNLFDIKTAIVAAILCAIFY